MEKGKNAPNDPTFLNLSQEGEAQFERLRTCLEIGQGFELFFCGFEAPVSFEEVKRRLTAVPPPGCVFQDLSLDAPDALLGLVERLVASGPTEAGRKILFVGDMRREEELRGIWGKSLRRLNERRNSVMRECPHAVILAGPAWLPWLAHDAAPDLWSVRTTIFTFPSPAPIHLDSIQLNISPWPSGLPPAHELQSPEYYEELATALEGSRRPGEQATCGRLLLYASAAWELHGDYDAALNTARKAGTAFANAGDEQMVAVSKGYVANILRQRGETDEAIHTLRGDVLPAFERLGDTYSKAVTMGHIADILQQRGETDEALRVRREEELPVYERLGDVRSKAVVMGRIADILQQRGETDEALRIRREEELPVYERLGDVREMALAKGKIAVIRAQRGETNEALHILNKDILPVFERLGDVRSKAVTMGMIADILQQRGETEEALRILLEEWLPVARKMGDMVSIAHIRYLCARIRLERSGLDKGEYQTVLEELAESFELSMNLQRVDAIASVGALFGQILAKVGQTKKALEVLETSASACDKLGWTDQAAQVRGMLAQLQNKS